MNPVNRAGSVSEISPRQSFLFSNEAYLKDHSHANLRYFDHRQNYRLTEGNLKIILNKGIGKQQR